MRNVIPHIKGTTNLTTLILKLTSLVYGIANLLMKQLHDQFYHFTRYCYDLPSYSFNQAI